MLGGVCVEGSDSHGPQRRNQGKRSDKQIPTLQAGEEQTGEELSTGGKQTELTFFADYLKSVIIFILSFSLLFLLFFFCVYHYKLLHPCILCVSATVNCARLDPID